MLFTSFTLLLSQVCVKLISSDCLGSWPKSTSTRKRGVSVGRTVTGFVKKCVTAQPLHQHRRSLSSRQRLNRKRHKQMLRHHQQLASLKPET